ncbi:41648_t:CDS:2, partial [Gigaspora margarita]
TEEDETKKFNQNILLATEYGTRDYGIEELENQIENLKSGKVQNISNQPNALSQELLHLDNHNQKSTIDEPRSKNATSSPSLSIEEEFTRETLSFNKNKIKCTIWDIPNETSVARIRKSLSFYGRTTIQSTMANGKSKAMSQLDQVRLAEVLDEEAGQQVDWPSASNFSNPLYVSDTELRIALHNINRLKANSQKMDALLEWAEQKDINII